MFRGLNCPKECDRGLPMPKRSREEKLAAYSKGAKRGYRSRKAFVKANGLKMKTAQPGEAEPFNDDPGGIVASRALGNAGLGDAAQLEKEQHNHGLYINETGSQGLHR
jgi:hypothetical protein